MSTQDFAQVLRTRISRRRHIKQLAGSVAAGLFPAGALWADDERPDSASSLTFSELPHGYDEHHHVAPGYKADILIRWGDALFADTAVFAPGRQTPDQQIGQFGYNNDFVEYLPLPLGSANSEHGLLCVNHEYTNAHLIFPGYTDRRDAVSRLTETQMRVEQEAVGMSVVEVKKTNGSWSVVKDSRYARRITAHTPMVLTGPAAGHARLMTGADPTGRAVLGTLGNCAGGVTPWGTVLSAEENFQDAFWGDRDKAAKRAPLERRGWDSFGTGLTAQARTRQSDAPVEKYPNTGWHRIDARFNIEKEPHESNRFGWIVEVDPYEPQSIPKKRTALGRFRHEAATVAAKPGQRAVVYSGDDQEFQFVYKFVSRLNFEPGNRPHNMNLLDDGDVYAAKFNADGTGEWIRLNVGADGDLGAALIDVRHVAAAAGATPMDRPEDIETSPVTDCTYLTLTKNSNRQAGDEDGPNPRAQNYWGQIIEIRSPGEDGQRDHTAATFEWDVLALGGDPNDISDDASGRPHAQTSRNGWFANPDNLAFDPKGRLWVGTDGMPDSAPKASGGVPVHDGVWAMDVAGEGRALPRHFFGCPVGAELSGPCFTPDGRTMFAAVQHPADEPGSTFETPANRWPDFDPALPPRPSVVVITKGDGGEIGS